MSYHVLRIMGFAAIAIFAGTVAQIALTKPWVARLGPITLDRHNKPKQYWAVTAFLITVAVASFGFALGVE